MKILIAMYDLLNYGGIINHTENLIYGFRELGHEVDLIGLSWIYKRSKKSVRKSSLHLYVPGAIYDVGQEYGWLWPEGKRFYYKGEENVKKWREYANKFDLVIWSVPVPTKMKQHKGNIDWLGLYELDTRQVCIVHDGNLSSSYPHIYEISHKLDGIICVHFSAFGTVKVLDVRRTLIFNPFDIDSIDLEDMLPYDERNKAILSLQTFKGWKRVRDFVNAVPYIDADIDLILRGDGIERRYMSSKNTHFTKSKKPFPKKYLNADGEKIWDVALEYGMDWNTYITPDERDEILCNSRTQLDSSWSHKYAGFGGHFNRVTIEAMIQGTIPVARNLGIAGNEIGTNELFTAYENYIMIPWDASPEEFADVINVANNLPADIAEDIIARNFLLLQHFDRKKICSDYIKFAMGEDDVGFYGKSVTSKLDDVLVMDSDDVIDRFFLNL